MLTEVQDGTGLESWDGDVRCRCEMWTLAVTGTDDGEHTGAWQQRVGLETTVGVAVDHNKTCQLVRCSVWLDKLYLKDLWERPVSGGREVSVIVHVAACCPRSNLEAPRTAGDCAEECSA